MLFMSNNQKIDINTSIDTKISVPIHFILIGNYTTQNIIKEINIEAYLTEKETSYQLFNKLCTSFSECIDEYTTCNKHSEGKQTYYYQLFKPNIIVMIVTDHKFVDNKAYELIDQIQNDGIINEPYLVNGNYLSIDGYNKLREVISCYSSFDENEIKEKINLLRNTYGEVMFKEALLDNGDVESKIEMNLKEEKTKIKKSKCKPNVTSSIFFVLFIFILIILVFSLLCIKKTPK